MTVSLVKKNNARNSNKATALSGVALHNASTAPLTATALAIVAEPIVTLRDKALSFDAATVDAYALTLDASFDRRDIFEASKGTAIVGKASAYAVEKARMMKAKIAVSRLFLALDLQASNVVERSLAENSMFSAYGLKKITELAQYVCGYGSKLEIVTRAFFACALIATDRGLTVIDNETNRRFLCSRGFTDAISDQELIAKLDELRLRSMSSGAETQSSQARNVLDVLGLGSIKSINKPRDSIVIDASHGLFTMFRGDFMK